MEGQGENIMKLFIVLCIAVMLCGCASTKMATSIGIDVGISFQKAAVKGEISAEQTIKAWPYVSGLIRGLLAEDYDFKVSNSAQFLMDELDGWRQKQNHLQTKRKDLLSATWFGLSTSQSRSFGTDTVYRCTGQ